MTEGKCRGLTLEESVVRDSEEQIRHLAQQRDEEEARR